MNPRTQVRPPASNTAPASLVQISSRTFMHCSAKSLAVLDSVKSAMTNLEKKYLIIDNFPGIFFFDIETSDCV